jgi:hypothetical protein
MTRETISDFVNMCVVQEVGSNYQFILTNSYSRTTYVIQIGKPLFDKGMEDRAVWEDKPFKVSELKPKIPVMTS